MSENIVTSSSSTITNTLNHGISEFNSSNSIKILKKFIKLYECPFCKKRNNLYPYIFNHIVEKHPNEKAQPNEINDIICNFCDEKFDDEKLLTDHYLKCKILNKEVIDNHNKITKCLSEIKDLISKKCLKETETNKTLSDTDIKSLKEEVKLIKTNLDNIKIMYDLAKQYSNVVDNNVINLKLLEEQYNAIEKNYNEKNERIVKLDSEEILTKKRKYNSNDINNKFNNLEKDYNNYLNKFNVKDD
jgi:hypothetical protein